jgi:tRNA threonylcarbamoyladenosine biosynthesis protein TsaB
LAEKRHRPLAAGGWLLAIESATAVAGAALWHEGAVRDEEPVARGESVAAGLLPAIDRLLRRAKVTVPELAAFAVGIGPGSFTGLRIGIATLKGLAFGSAALAAPVSTLAALARAAGERPAFAGPEPVVAALDARRGEVYAGAFLARGEEAHPCLPEGVYTPAALLACLPSRCRLVGEGASIVHAALRDAALSPELVFEPEPAASAREIAELGAPRLAAGQGLPAAALVPRYLRRAEAEVRRTGERFE